MNSTQVLFHKSKTLFDELYNHFHAQTDVNHVNNHCLIQRIHALLESMLDNENHIDNNSERTRAFDSQKSALLYIVVLLSFYAFAIGLIMIKYIQKERKEWQECEKYSKRQHHFTGSPLITRLALNANKSQSKVTFV